MSKANDKFIKNYEMYDGDVDWQGEATTYATKTIKDWVSKGYISKDCTGTKAEDAGQGFMNGTYPMFFSGTWWFGRFQSDMKNANWTFSTFPIPIRWWLLPATFGSFQRTPRRRTLPRNSSTSL